MRHGRKTKYFSRKFNARKAMLRSLVVSLVEHGRIRTTLAKAKELRSHVEKAITVGKGADQAATRLLLSRFPHKETVKKIITDVSKRFENRQGGYTRIIKLDRRPGDNAEMAFIEFSDYDWKIKSEGSDKKDIKKGKSVTKKNSEKEQSEESVMMRGPSKTDYRKYRKIRKRLQKRSRQESRA